MVITNKIIAWKIEVPLLNHIFLDLLFNESNFGTNIDESFDNRKWIAKQIRQYLKDKVTDSTSN